MKRRVISFVLALLMAVVLVPTQDVEAASKKKKAMKAYSTFLKAHPSEVLSFGDDYFDVTFSPDVISYVDSYSIKDLNKDKIPELITHTNVNFRWSVVRIYTWKDNKVKLYAEFNNCSTADGWYSFYICKKGHIHNDYSGSYSIECSAFKAGKDKANSYLTYTEDYLYETKSIKKNGKTISEKKYNKLTKNCKKIEMKAYTNNKKNQKLLKKGKAGKVLFDYGKLFL